MKSSASPLSVGLFLLSELVQSKLQSPLNVRGCLAGDGSMRCASSSRSRERRQFVRKCDGLGDGNVNG